VQLSVFEVTTSKDIGYQSTNAAEVTRMNTPIENIPMNVTIFNQQFIEDLLATDTSELLAYEASSVKTSENDGFQARGSTSVGTNFLDGFSQTAGFGSQPLANIERVEVIRGPAAILYGSGGYGGTYNRITKQPQPKRFVSFRTILSDKTSYRTELDTNLGKLPVFGGERLLFRFNGILDRGTTWFGQRRREDGIAPTLTWLIGPNTKLIAGYIYNFRDTQASWETPLHAGNPKGLVTGDGVFRVMPRKTHWGIPEDYRHNTRQVASADLRHAFTRNLQFRSQFQYETRDQEMVETLANGTTLSILRDTALTGRSWRIRPRITRNYRTRNEVVWNFRTGPVNHRLLAGHGWAEQYDHDITSASASSGNNNSYPNVTYAQFLANPALAGHTNPLLLLPVNLFDRGAEPPVPPIPQRPPVTLSTDVQTYTASQDFYVNDVFSVIQDRVFVMAGARQTDFRRKTITWNRGAVKLASAPTVYDIADATTSSVGAVWHLNAAKTLSLYGNLNNSFAPEFRSNPDGSKLDPQTGEQQEIGVRFSLLQGRVQGLVTAFDLIQDNVTRSDPDRVGYFIQDRGQRSTGFEISLNGRVTDSWLVMGGFSNTDSRNDRTGEATALAPQYRFTMFNRYNLSKGALKGLSLSLGTIYNGERPLTSSTTRNSPNWGPIPSWWRFDATVGYKLRLPKSRFAWGFAAKVTNVLDNTEMYYVAANHRFTLDPGRQWQVVGGVKF
jgi:outer membrane receptor protein involved in Fe transport